MFHTRNSKVHIITEKWYNIRTTTELPIRKTMIRCRMVPHHDITRSKVHEYLGPTRCTLAMYFYRLLVGLVDAIRQIVLKPTILADRRLWLALRRGHRLRPFFVVVVLYRHTPQHASPRHVVRAALFATNLSLALALTAHEADGLPVPVVHQVKRDATRQIERQRRRKLNKAITKVRREHVLNRASSSVIGRENGGRRHNVPPVQRRVRAYATRRENTRGDGLLCATPAASARGARVSPCVCAPCALSSSRRPG